MSICIQANDQIITLLKLDCMEADKGHCKYIIMSGPEIIMSGALTCYVAARDDYVGAHIYHVRPLLIMRQVLVRFCESHSHLEDVTVFEVRRDFLNVMMTSWDVLALCVGNSQVTGEFSSQRQGHGALLFSLICAWTHGWVNNRDAGNLRRYRAHYDVMVMVNVYNSSNVFWQCWKNGEITERRELAK